MAFLTGRELKLYLAAVGALTLLALLITVLIMLLGGGGGGGRERAPDTPAAEYSGGESLSSLGIGGQMASRMEVPQEYKRLFEADWVPFRRVRSEWSREQIDRYWIEPREIVEQQLEKESEAAVRGFLEELP